MESNLQGWHRTESLVLVLHEVAGHNHQVSLEGALQRLNIF